jgi:glycosyltransferase involved in cell wall biosynthesis
LTEVLPERSGPTPRPLASVVITNHDYGRFVGAAIDSALSQSHPAVEVIVVDDGSTDDSARVLASYDDRVTVVMQPCGGQAAACNTGFARSEGGVVVFLDADDLLGRNAVALAVAALAPGTAKVQWPQVTIDEHGSRHGVFPKQPLAHGDLRPLLIEDGPLSFPSAPMSGNAFPRSALDEIMPIPEDYRICADSYLNAMSPLLGSVRTLSRAHGCRRMHGSNWSARPLDRRLADSLDVWTADCRYVRRRLEAEGVTSIGDWNANPFVHSMRRMACALATVVRCTRRGDHVIVVGTAVQHGECALSGRRTVLLDQSATTSTGALRAIDRHRRDGARVLAVAWPAFAWLDQNPLREVLSERHDCIAASDDVVVFALDQ